MSSSSSAAAVTAMAAALGAPSTEKLTRDNFQFWKMQALPAIQGAQAMGLLDGSDAPPPQNLEEDAEKQKSAVPNGEKDELIRRHQEELSAQKTSYQELKSQLIQLGLDHAKAIKAAETDAAAKMDEALEDASNATVVISSAANTSAAASSSAAAPMLPAASTTSTTAAMASSSSRPLVSPFLAALLDGRTPPPLSGAPISTSAGLYMGATPRATWPFASAAASVPAVVGPLPLSAASPSPGVAGPIAVPPSSLGVTAPAPAQAPGTSALAPFVAAPAPTPSSTAALATSPIPYGAGLYGQPLFYGATTMAYGVHSPPPASATTSAAYVPPAPITHEAGPVRDPSPVHLAHLVTRY
nr:uncharacterized protein LOC127304340 [Lolium perenne]